MVARTTGSSVMATETLTSGMSMPAMPMLRSERHRQRHERKQRDTDGGAEYPHLVEVVGGYVAKSGYDYATEFVFGLDLILDGLDKFRDTA